MKKIKFLITAESYDPNIGGCIVLHKLCDVLNRQGYDAKLVPAYNNFIFNKRNRVIPFLKFVKERIRRSKRFKVNKEFLTPVAKPIELRNIDNNCVVVYPETISGNPLNARHVVRWFLHHPGFHNKNVLYGTNELYFRYHSGINVPNSLEQSVADLELRIVSYPLELYNLKGVGKERSGSAYMIRKGIGKEILHDLTDSILIDGKSHQEIAEIFKRVQVFYSYDPYTSYSTFGPLCGCDAVVFPDVGVPVNEWIPDHAHRAGIAYGPENIIEARGEWPLLQKRVADELANNPLVVEKFVLEVRRVFGEI